MKILQVLHFSLAGLDPSSEQECTAQPLSAGHCHPLGAHVMVASPPLASFHLATVGTALLLPGDLSTSQVGDAPPAGL